MFGFLQRWWSRWTQVDPPQTIFCDLSHCGNMLPAWTPEDERRWTSLDRALELGWRPLRRQPDPLIFGNAMHPDRFHSWWMTVPGHDWMADAKRRAEEVRERLERL